MTPRSYITSSPASAEAASDAELAQQLVTLIINQDHLAMNWLKFLVTVQAGFVVSFAFLIRRTPDVASTSLASTAIVLIPALAAIVAVALAEIAVYERRWQSWYVERFNALPSLEGAVFPAGHPVHDKTRTVKVTKPENMPMGLVDRTIRLLGWFLVVAWMVVLRIAV